VNTEINKLETYINANNNPILRKCENCFFWNRMSGDKQDTGFCSRQKIYFAHTLELTRYFQTKFCDLCLQHQFKNEKELTKFAKKVLLVDVLKTKEEIKNTEVESRSKNI
jgi:hypothetical protein